VALDIIRPLPEIKFGNKYVIVTIVHYSKWCEVKHVKEHIIETTIKKFKEKIIYKFRVPKCVFIDNGGERMAKFDMMCNFFGIAH
jgi:hypothetical protein